VCGSAHGQGFASAPTTNLCADGSTPATSGEGPWTWECEGINGGLPASCSASNAINGVCGDFTTALCSVGTNTTLSLSGTNWVWSCQGIHGGNNASCSAAGLSRITLVTNGNSRGSITLYNNKLYLPRSANSVPHNPQLLDVVNLANNAVSQINLGTPIHRGGIMEHNGRLYIPWYNASTKVSYLDVVNTANNAVSTMQLSAPRVGTAMAEYNNKLYITYGTSNQYAATLGDNNSVLAVVDTTNNALSQINLGVADNRLSVIVHNNKLYMPRTTALDILDLSDGSVSTIALGTGNGGTNAVIHDNKLYMGITFNSILSVLRLPPPH